MARVVNAAVLVLLWRAGADQNSISLENSAFRSSHFD